MIGWQTGKKGTDEGLFVVYRAISWKHQIPKLSFF
jgi:hypothetical protein